MIRSRRLAWLLALPTLTLCSVQSACSGGDPDATRAEPAADAPAAPPSARSSMLALTPVTSPVLRRLKGDHSVTDAPSAEALRTRPEQALHDVRMVVADMALLGADGLAPHKSVVDAASRAGIPVVLENVRDSAPMAAAFGYGIAGDAIVVEPSRGGAKLTMTRFGAPVGSATKREAPASMVRADVPKESPLAQEEAIAISPNAATEAVVSDIPSQVAAHMDALSSIGLRTLSVPAPSSIPSGAYRDILVNVPPATYTFPGTSQTAAYDLSYEVELIASTTPNNKFLVVSSLGSGAKPGTLTNNANDHRGYFQDQVGATVIPSSSALSLYTWSPKSLNPQTSYSSSAGCAVGGRGGFQNNLPVLTVNFNCSGTGVANQTLTDFVLHDNTNSAGLTSAWLLQMTNAQGQTYSGPASLIDPISGLRTLPVAATSTLKLAYQTVYSAPSSLNDRVPLHVEGSQGLWDIGISWFLVPALLTGKKVDGRIQTWASDGIVDFSTVSATIPTVTFTNQASGLDLDVFQSQTTAEAPVILGGASGNPSQSFATVPTGDADKSVFIKAKHSGMCLDIPYSSVQPGTRVNQFPCTGNPNQKFIPVPIGANLLLKNVNSGLCLSALPAGSDGVAYIDQEACNSAQPAQLFLPH